MFDRTCSLVGPAPCQLSAPPATRLLQGEHNHPQPGLARMARGIKTRTELPVSGRRVAQQPRHWWRGGAVAPALTGP